MKIILETPRLLLREFEMPDAEAVLELHSNPEVQKYTGQDIVTSLDDIKHDIEHIWEHEYKKYGYARWATIFKEDEKLIGWAGLKYLPEFNEIDLGYRFVPEYWGRGIATEISLEIVKYAFDTLGLERIIGISMQENLASIRVLEKSGLTFDKLGPYEAKEPVEVAWYSLDKKDFDSTT